MNALPALLDEKEGGWSFDENGEFRDSVHLHATAIEAIPSLPLEPLFLDFNGADLVSWDAGSPGDEVLAPRLAGALLRTGGLHERSTEATIWLAEAAGVRVLPGVLSWSTFPNLRVSGLGPEVKDPDLYGPEVIAAENLAAAERIVAALQWLQSFNVDLVEAKPSRQERRAVERAGGQIALTVQVKQTKRYTSASQTNGKANYSHRFETRGHYKHHFELKADGEPSKTFAACHRKDPSRLITVDGKPCFRFWVPPFVTGPMDKPFVPKVRVADAVPPTQ
ncbi:MAG TPA: hypothetical protein VEW07_11385 [Solirubrobacterales bacterium]|nr:hypothetical protein [Solirubrobacterales bacterium]